MVGLQPRINGWHIACVAFIRSYNRGLFIKTSLFRAYSPGVDLILNSLRTLKLAPLAPLKYRAVNSEHLLHDISGRV
jgi:hypothetical protein